MEKHRLQIMAYEVIKPMEKFIKENAICIDEEQQLYFLSQPYQKKTTITKKKEVIK